MDITPRKRAQIVVALRQHSNMIIRKIVEKQNVSKSNVGRILKIMDTNRNVTKTKKRGQRGRKHKTTSHDHKMILQNSFKDLRKTSKEGPSKRFSNCRSLCGFVNHKKATS